MMKPQFFKPFDLAAARAGAPFCCRDGRPADILKWDGRRPGEPLIGFQSDNDIPASWAVDGAYETGSEGDIDLVMLPLGVINGKPVFVGDAFLWHDGTPNVATAEMAGGDWGRCAWPAPAKDYPKTTMDVDDLLNIWRPELTADDGVIAVANAALRHAIDAGQIVDAEESAEAVRKAYADGQTVAYQHETGGRAARDIAVAAAVRDELVAGVARYSTSCKEYISAGFDFEAIIATVK